MPCTGNGGAKPKSKSPGSDLQSAMNTFTGCKLATCGFSLRYSWWMRISCPFLSRTSFIGTRVNRAMIDTCANSGSAPTDANAARLTWFMRNSPSVSKSFRRSHAASVSPFLSSALLVSKDLVLSWLSPRGRFRSRSVVLCSDAVSESVDFRFTAEWPLVSRFDGEPCVSSPCA